MTVHRLVQTFWWRILIYTDLWIIVFYRLKFEYHSWISHSIWMHMNILQWLPFMKSIFSFIDPLKKQKCQIHSCLILNIHLFSFYWIGWMNCINLKFSKLIHPNSFIFKVVHKFTIFVSHYKPINILSVSIIA